MLVHRRKTRRKCCWVQMWYVLNYFEEVPINASLQFFKKYFMLLFAGRHEKFDEVVLRSE